MVLDDVSDTAGDDVSESLPQAAMTVRWERSVSDADDVRGEARPVRRRGGGDDWRGDASGDSCATTRVRTGESSFQCQRLTERSRSDFIVIDLPTIVDEFADNFYALPIAYPDRPRLARGAIRLTGNAELWPIRFAIAQPSRHSGEQFGFSWGHTANLSVGASG